MRGPNLQRMAWRNLWRNRRRTILTLISIGFGAFLAVLFTALQDRSFSDMIDSSARLGGGHVSIQHEDYLDRPALTRTIVGGRGLKDLALSDPVVDRAVSRITGATMLSTATGSYGAFFVAFDPEDEDAATFSFLDSLVDGAMFSGDDPQGIVLGKRLASNLKLEVGKKVVYTMTDRKGEIVAGLGRLRGIVATGARSMDAGLCLMPIDAIRGVLGYEADESTQIAVFVGDSRRSKAVAERLSGDLREGVVALTWSEVLPDLSGFIAMKVGGARFMEAVIMMLVAAGIFNTLFVSVMERLREFGILMAIGFSPGQIFRLVIWESVWLAILGLAAGALLTATPYYYLAKHGLDYSAILGEDSMEVAGAVFPSVMRVGIFPENLALIGFAVLLSTLSAGLYPAWRAGNVVPVESIKLV